MRAINLVGHVNDVIVLYTTQLNELECILGLTRTMLLKWGSSMINKCGVFHKSNLTVNGARVRFRCGFPGDKSERFPKVRMSPSGHHK